VPAPRDVARYRPRNATTTFRVLRTEGEWAIVEARASSAIRHQIRVHMAAIEHPLAGDTLYDGPQVRGLSRHVTARESRRLEGHGFRSAFDVRSPLPADLVAAFRLSAISEAAMGRPAERRCEEASRAGEASTACSRRRSASAVVIAMVGQARPERGDALVGASPADPAQARETP